MKLTTRSVVPILLLLLLSACSAPDGVSYDINLYRGEDGLIYRKDSNVLFTGHTYMEVCEECSMPLFNSWPVHFVGNYLNGKKHGVFWYPKSGHSDGHFEYHDRANQRKVVYEHGKLVEPGP